MGTEQEYVLGTHQEELSRLGVQHRLWRSHAYEGWERAGFGSARRILDLGCGPGYAAIDIAQLAGARASVLAVDVSRRFLDHLEERCRELGLANVECRQQDALDLDLEPASLDAAWCRWLLCFLPEPERAVASVASALRPGGSFVVHEYSHYRSMRVAPRSEIFETVVRKIDESWRERGGDPDIGCRLPAMLQRHGLEVRDVRPLSRIARPGDLLWQWPDTFYANYIPILAKSGAIAAQERASFEALWRERSADPSAYWISPFMVEILAYKR